MNDHRRGNGIGAYCFCIILLLLLALTPSAADADTMFRANPEHTGEYDNGGIMPTNTELWRFKGIFPSSPAVSNGIVYVGSVGNNLYAIDAVTGREIWHFNTGGSVFSSPAVSNGVVYIGSGDKNLHAIDAETGKEKWRFATGSWVDSSPAVSNGVVYVGSDDKNLYAIDAGTGEEKWRFKTGDEVRSSPAVAGGVVYVGSRDTNLYAIDAVTGKEKWRFMVGRYMTSPAVAGGVVYVGSDDTNLYAIDAGTGKEKWRFWTNSVVRESPAVSNGVVYVGSIILYAIDAGTGEEKWRFWTESYVSSSPSVSNGVVYVGSDDTNLYAIDAGTGEEKWRFKTGGGGQSSPAVANGIVYAEGSDNSLYAIGEVPSIPKTTPTVVSTQGVQITPSTLPPSNSGYSNLTLPIIVILAVLFLAGGGYAIYRIKKTPSSYQPLDSKEIKVIAPPPQENSLHDSSKSQNDRDLIFISSKSEDFDYAQQVYTFLKEQGYNVFFSQQSLPDVGSSDYRKEIDRSLDNSKHMIVVTSKKEYVASSWVEAEWGLFINEKRSGRKSGNIITLIIGSMRIEDLPSSLRYYEVIPFDPKAFEKILKYLK